MTLLIRCPVCSQALVSRGAQPGDRARCPTCDAPLRIARPRLAEAQVLDILTGRATARRN